jgi:hypothetical protein
MALGPSKGTKMNSKWEKKVYWRFIYQLGWFFKAARNLYLKKIRKEY